MDLKNYFNSGSKKQELSSETLTSGDNPKKYLMVVYMIPTTQMMFLLKDYGLLTVLRFYITLLRMLRNKYKAFTVKQKKPK